MNFEIYCDESRQELISTKKAVKENYFIIGGIWIEASERQVYKEQIKAIKKKHNLYGEIKWKNVSPSKISFYNDLVDCFFSWGLKNRFRCVVVNKKEVDLIRYHEADAELGFYKFYYQLIHHWILDFNVYNIFLDYKTNKVKNRLHVLRRVLLRSNLSSEIKCVQAIPSKESLFIQLADFLIGAVGYKFNEYSTSEAKLSIIERIEKHIKCPIKHTPLCENKFNIFKIILQGGW